MGSTDPHGSVIKVLDELIDKARQGRASKR
jgi:hypothetical protein